jgi:hypothetical protein
VTINLTKRPAVLLALAVALINAFLAATEAGGVGGAFSIVNALRVGLPLAAGALTQAGVVPVETLREMLTWTRSGNDLVAELARKVEVAVPDRPDRPGM